MIVHPIVDSILVVADTHLNFADKNYTYRGLSPMQKFLESLPLLKSAAKNATMAIHLGDLCGDKSYHPTKLDYDELQQHFSSFEIPFWYLVGNHDYPDEVARLNNASAIQSTLISDKLSILQRNGYQIAVLNSSVFSERGGDISSQTLIELDIFLSQSKLPTLIALHHPTLPVHCPWIDLTMLIKQGAQVHELFKKHEKKILAVLNGHIHSAISKVVEGVHYISCPSIFYPFDVTPSVTDGQVASTHLAKFLRLDITTNGIQANFA